MAGSHSPDRRVAVVELVGEIDAASRTATIDLVCRALSHGPLTIEVDLSQVSFMDCAGVGALVQARAFAEDEGCVLYVRSLSKPVAWLLGLTDLLDSFTGGYGPESERPPPQEGPTAADRPAGQAAVDR